MANTSDLMEGSLPALAATMLGQDLNSTVSAAGTTQATATQLKGGVSLVTTVASGAGVIFPNAQAAPTSAVVNGGANPLTLYPAVGETINNLAANAGIQIAPNKVAIIVASGKQLAVILGA